MHKALFTSLFLGIMVLAFNCSKPEIILPEDIKNLNTQKKIEDAIQTTTGSFKWNNFSVWVKAKRFTKNIEALTYYKDDIPQKAIKSYKSNSYAYCQTRNAIWFWKGKEVAYYIFLLHDNEWQNLSIQQSLKAQKKIDNFLKKLLTKNIVKQEHQ